MRFHVVSLPHTQTTKQYSACAYTEKVRKFCNMMTTKGHEVFLYAGVDNEANVAEHIPCITERERAAAVGADHYTHASFDYSLSHWKKFNTSAIVAISERLQQEDFLCLIGGLAQKQIADALPAMMAVEFGIGYGGSFSKYRVWESYAWMHTCYGAESNRNPHGIDGRWFDAVIPGYFDPADFPFREQKDDYFLFIGRLTDRKGFAIAADLCQKAGKRLVIAGQGTPPEYGEYVGVVGPEERAQLMSRAKAVFVPTVYIEPFGNVAVEAQACGTPVICTDWGAMTETVLQGKTGFRCRTFREFKEAMEDVIGLDPYDCYANAMHNYSMPVIAEKYEEHFRRLKTLYGGGWYA